MGTLRKWHFGCILAVIALTLYNIAPTIFYYSKPLQAKVKEADALLIAKSIGERVNHLEKESTEWVQSFCDLLSIHPKDIFLSKENPQWISVSFKSSADAKKFRNFLPKAGSNIPFAPASLHINPICDDEQTVLIQRMIPYHIEDIASLFSFAEKEDGLDRQILLSGASHIVELLSQKAPSSETVAARLKQDGKYSFEDGIFRDLSVDFAQGSFFLSVHPNQGKKAQSILSGVSRQLNLTREKILATSDGFKIPFHTLENRSGSLVLRLDTLAKLEIATLFRGIQAKWHPTHPDLKTLSFVEEKEYEMLPLEEKGLCIVALQKNSGSISLAVKGVERIGQSYIEHEKTPLAETFRHDLHTLYTILAHHGFSVTQEKPDLAFACDSVLEKAHFALPLLMASREDFFITPDQKYALLDVSTKEQRILAENKIDTQMHQELISWADEYRAAQVSLDTKHRFNIPKPTRNVFWNNCLLSLKKMVRGDDRKILRWGLDLSGGKTVEIELRDDHHQVVRSDAEIKQGMQELYQRVGKMGLSEVSIRQVGDHIVLDFPGSQALSAADLISASSMYFYIVNEKFSVLHPTLGNTVHQFLQTVWDEAVFLNKTDSLSLQEIAKQHLSSGAGKTLAEHGLTIGEPQGCRILVQKGSGAPHPLMIAFYEPALEGSQLENIHAAYDPSRGNYLSFAIASSVQTRDGSRINPQEILYSWTSRYAKEAISGLPQESDSRGRGWRMAVVLNDSVISSPTLDSALKDSAMISGHFSQTEVQKLCADLKAGSMTFTPHILSEKNVSPELGHSDRMQGILATVAALLLVIGSMLVYYRFAGLIASIAVLFNLLILWGILQNLGAALSLAGIAGIILTVGMSIDANVLVFERIKEELAQGKALSLAIAAGYKKAFSAILDSNVTTIIASLILLNFDAGPIKSFAMNLIIGITASMFTALFMTRVYFTYWAQNPKRKVLKMAHWIRETSFNFLKKARLSFAVSIAIIALGCGALFIHSSSIFGLDFTGGFSMHLNVQKVLDKDASYAGAVTQAFLNKGAEKQDFQVQELNPSNQLRILLAENMNNEGKPFFGFAIETPKEGAKHLYENNPRIAWVVNALQEAGIVIEDASLAKLHSEWTSVSGQMSNTMRNQAILGFSLSFLAIFIYLAFRFEYKFAAAAVVCLIHDLLITLAVMGLLHALHVPIQIDLITIAALMTAVGYSLNDTIIIFDRIREEMQRSIQYSLAEVVNTALNSTLSRTLITSGTTLFVLIALLVLGGNSIFGFACVMTIGVIFGSLSSWFIAAPLMLLFNSKEEGQKNLWAQLSQIVK